jgi:hypothetical protein
VLLFHQNYLHLSSLKNFRFLSRIQFTFEMIPRFQRVVKRPHRVYAHKEIDDILNYLAQADLSRGAIPQISRDTGIPCKTMRDWHRQRTQGVGENWFPLAQGHPQTRALSAENETGFADFIRVNHIQTGKGATRG